MPYGYTSTIDDHPGRKESPIAIPYADNVKLEKLSYLIFALLEETESNHQEKADTTERI